LITPLFARVLLKRDSVQTKSKLIIIPEQAEKRLAPTTGIVIAVGPTCDESIKPGQHVVFGQHAGAWVKLPGSDEEHFVCQDEDIIGVIE
jgi:chaperonin GroES